MRSVAKGTGNPELYEQFRRYRQRAAQDVLGSISIVDTQVIYDLGCGTGRIPRELAQHFPNRQVVEVDEGAALRPYLAALGDNRDEFMGAVESQILATYPPRLDGITLYPFRRLFVCGIAS